MARVLLSWITWASLCWLASQTGVEAKEPSPSTTSSFPEDETNELIDPNHVTRKLWSSAGRRLQQQYVNDRFETLRINCGTTQGLQTNSASWLPDSFYDGGYPLVRTTQTILGSTDKPALYQSQRRSLAFDSSFQYEIPLPNDDYTVVFHFAELVYDSTGERVFAISMEGQLEFDNVDILELTQGAAFTSTTLRRRVLVTDGALSINFVAIKGNAAINGLEILQTFPPQPGPTVPAPTSTVSPPPPPPPPPQTPPPPAPVAMPAPVPVSNVVTGTDPVDFEPILINVGGPEYEDIYHRMWAADATFAQGGTTYSNSFAITETEDDFLYISERYGSFSYEFDLPVATYELILHFAETFYTSIGDRIFSIRIQDSMVYQDLDILALTEDRLLHALTLESTQVVSDGKLRIEFLRGAAGVPKLCGIEINYVEPHLAHAVANGPFQAVDTDDNGYAAVQLDGSPSHTHAFGHNLVYWEWKINGVVVSNQESDSVQVAVGMHVATLFVRDDAGNESADSTAIEVLSAGFAHVSYVSPSEGAVSGGETVLINGAGFNYFATETKVHFGSTTLTGSSITIVNENTIRVQAPVAAFASPVSVVVETPLGRSNAGTFTYIDGVPIDFVGRRLAYIYAPTTAAFGPDEKLYVGTGEGKLYKLTLNSSFSSVVSTVVSTVIADVEERQILGITFDPMDTSSNPTVYAAHSVTFHGEPNSSSGGSINGKISKVSGANLDQVEDIITGLPVSDHDHAINGMEFGHDGELYITVAGNTNSGVPGRLSASRVQKDNVLSSSILVANLTHPQFDGHLQYDAPDDGNLVGGTGIEMFAYGFRNPYDIVLHSNGNLYATDNGPDKNYGDRSMSCTTQLPEVEEDDKLLLVQRGHYYGQPNRKRGVEDPRQCIWHSVNEASTDEYTAPMAVLPSSSNGLVEFRSNHFRGQLRGNLITALYKKSLYRTILSPDGTRVLGEPVALTGGNTLDVTQAPDGSLVDTRYLVGTVHRYEPVSSTGSLYVNAVFPHRGPGGVLKIYGESFAGTLTVTVGGSACPLLSRSLTRLTCQLPQRRDGVVDVVVSNGSSSSVLGDAYRYISGGR